MNILLEWNKSIFLLINRYHSPIVDKLMLFFTSTGNGLILATVILIMLAICDKKKCFRVFSTVLLAGVIGGVLVYLLKYKIGTLRPLSVFPEAHFLGEPLKLGSFPSGHAQLAFSTSAVLAKEYKKSWKFLYLWALIVGFSRIYIGAHFPIDVIAGGVIGYLSGKFILWYNWLFNKEICSPERETIMWQGIIHKYREFLPVTKDTPYCNTQ